MVWLYSLFLKYSFGISRFLVAIPSKVQIPFPLFHPYFSPGCFLSIVNFNSSVEMLDFQISKQFIFGIFLPYALRPLRSIVHPQPLMTRPERNLNGRPSVLHRIRGLRRKTYILRDNSTSMSEFELRSQWLWLVGEAAELLYSSHITRKDLRGTTVLGGARVITV